MWSPVKKKKFYIGNWFRILKSKIYDEGRNARIGAKLAFGLNAQIPLDQSHHVPIRQRVKQSSRDAQIPQLDFVEIY